MNKESEILDKLNIIFKNVFKNDNLKINLSTIPKDIEKWDSFNQMILITAIEKDFKINFSLNEILNFKSVELIVNCIKNKIS